MTAPAAPLSRRLEAMTLRLTAQSVNAAASPNVRFAWPARPAPDRLAMSEALLPLAGHPLLRELDDEQRWHLALVEAVHFFSLNIAGERELLAGLAARLEGDTPLIVSRYLRHFLDEENAHTAVFTRFCLDYGGRIFQDRQVRFPQVFLPGEADFLFFAQALVFEEIAHFYNRQQAADDALWTLARDINRYHAEDEARHIAFGRVFVADLWERFGAQWNPEEKRRIGGYLSRYIQAVQRSYVNEEVYRTLGLPDTIRDEILASAHWTALAEKSAREITRWLRLVGVTGQ